jgi:hyperosmotically inducible periplasmic protein
MRRLLASGLVAAALTFAQTHTNDDKLYDKVRMKLAENPDVNGGGIDVTVKEGVVTLKGRVMKEKQKIKAGQVARKVKGVKSVDNQLVVETK